MKLLPNFIKKTKWYQRRLHRNLRKRWEEGFTLALTAPDLDSALRVANRLNRLDLIITSLEVKAGSQIDWSRLDALIELYEEVYKRFSK